MPIYNKLVRDLIPQSIEAVEKKYVAYALDHEEFKNAILDKLIEEAVELKHAWSNDPDQRDTIVEELGDVYEALYYIREVLQISEDEIHLVRERKAIKKGRFDQRIFLYEVLED